MRAVISVIMFVALVLLTLTNGVWAEDSGVEFGIFGSYISGDDITDGFGPGVKLELQPSDWFSIDARASYISFDDSSVDMYPLEMAALLNIPMADEQVVPYAGVGVGYYFLDSAHGYDIDDKVGFFPLVGLEIGTQELSFMVEARWLFLDSDLDNAYNSALDKGGDFDGIGVNLGLLFRF